MKINIKRIVINFLSCFILIKNKRKKFREKMLVKRIGYNDADKYCTGIPIEPWAFIRAKRYMLKKYFTCYKKRSYRI